MGIKKRRRSFLWRLPVFAWYSITRQALAVYLTYLWHSSDMPMTFEDISLLFLWSEASLSLSPMIHYSTVFLSGFVRFCPEVSGFFRFFPDFFLSRYIIAPHLGSWTVPRGPKRSWVSGLFCPINDRPQPDLVRIQYTTTLLRFTALGCAYPRLPALVWSEIYSIDQLGEPPFWNAYKKSIGDQFSDTCLSWHATV